jgi:hypothetical protein
MTIETAGDHIELVDPATGVVQHWPVEPCDFLGPLAWSAAGDRLFLGSSCGQNRRIVALAPGRPPEKLWEGDPSLSNLAAAPDGDPIALVQRYESKLVVIDGL